MISVELKPLDANSKVYYLFYTFEEDWKPAEFITAAQEAEQLVEAANPAKLYSMFYMKRKVYTANIPGVMQMIAKIGRNKLNSRIQYTYVIGTTNRVIHTSKLFADALHIKVSFGLYDTEEQALQDMRIRSQH